MGRDVDYQPCPISPSGQHRKMRKCVLFSLVATNVVFLVLLLIFLGLYLQLQFSEPVKQLQECQNRRQNQTSQTQAEITALRQSMAETQEAAKKEAGILNHKLEATNKSLAETQKNWHSCQNQLSALQDNVTSLEAKEHLQTETIKNLQQQLKEKSKQLEDEQRNIQEERNRYQAEIQQLEKQKQQDNPNSGVRDFADLSMALLTIMTAGFLSM